MLGFGGVPGEMIQFDEHVLQMGWFNHQLVFEDRPGSSESSSDPVPIADTAQYLGFGTL